MNKNPILCYLLWLVSVSALVIAIISLVKKSKETYKKVKNPMRLKNPGCDVQDQTNCTMAMRYGKCSDNEDCVECNDYEGEGCVPKYCECSACPNSPNPKCKKPKSKM